MENNTMAMISVLDYIEGEEFAKKMKDLSYLLNNEEEPTVLHIATAKLHKCTKHCKYQKFNKKECKWTHDEQ
jgi:hypothetical protein